MPLRSIDTLNIIQTTINVTIADGDATGLSSSTGDLSGLTPLSLIVPAGIEGTTFTFQVAYDDAVSTFADLHYDNVGTDTEFTVQYVASQRLSIAPYLDRFLGVRAIKMRTGTAGTPTQQTGNAVIGVVCGYL